MLVGKNALISASVKSGIMNSSDSKCMSVGMSVVNDTEWLKCWLYVTNFVFLYD